MSAFHDVRLDLPAGFGARGGPERRTEIVELASGRERRSTPWAHARRRYDIVGAPQSLDEAQALIAFFEARRGRLHGFRFRDFADWRSCPPSATPGPLDQLQGSGDGARTVFPLVKTYGEGDAAYVRPIRKPVADSVRVAVGGSEVASAAFTLNAEGAVVFAVPPAMGAAVTAGFAFDVPVRFDADRLELTLEAFGAARSMSVSLVEIV